MNDPTPQFRATGKGLGVKLPNFPATSANANAWLTNSSLQPTQKFDRIYLFVTGVTTGWTVAGSHGQSPTSRTFYPQHLGQDLLQIDGIVANQYEYDRLVEFIMYHQQRCLAARDDIGSRDLQFMMPRKIVQAVGSNVQHTLYPGMHYGGYIEGIDAGHSRFQFARTWTIGMRIGNDFLQDVVDMKAYSDQAIQNSLLSTFGTRYKGSSVKQPNLSEAPDPPSTQLPRNVDVGEFWGNQSGGSIFA